MSSARNSAGGRIGRPTGWLRFVLVLAILAFGLYWSRRDESARENRPAPADTRAVEDRSVADRVAREHAADAEPTAATREVDDGPLVAQEPPTSGTNRFESVPSEPSSPEPEPAPRSVSRGSPAVAEQETTPARRETLIARQRIYDLDRNLIYEGDIDVGPTLARIEAGKRLRFPNDGATFQNRERRLPRQPAGYYREYVHPTDELLPSPGPQRIVIGEAGETYYTPDHYKTFRRLDRPE
jgi:ribonuclease T1